MAKKGLSLHIGVNEVNPRHYMGWTGRLLGCENDARDMQRIADSLGYQSKLLLTKDATIRKVTGAIQDAAAAMVAGDTFFLTYSGHGAQVPDLNGDESLRDLGEVGETFDERDETWVLYDRMLVDDELWALWAQFPARSRIFVLSDSCHSGTVTKNPEIPWAVLAGIVAPGAEDVEERRSKRMPLDVEETVVRARRSTYARIEREVPPREAAEVQATVALVSGCADNQTSLDGRINGLFTENLLAVYDEGRFRGSLRALRDLVAARMPATQTPNYYVAGKPNSRSLRRPAFAI
jgi:hypothetical protein